MSSASENVSQITLIKEIKDKKLLRALKGEVPKDEPQLAFHKYVDNMSLEEKCTLIQYITKEEFVLTQSSTTQISLEVATHKDLNFPLSWKTLFVGRTHPIPYKEINTFFVCHQVQSEISFHLTPIPPCWETRSLSQVPTIWQPL